MICRCYNKNHKTYKHYGGRGVKVCDEWRNDYQKFLDWSLANGWAKGLQLDKDIKGNGLLYSPETCSWVTRIQNCNNRKNSVKYEYNGLMVTAPEISRMSGIRGSLIYQRLRRGLTAIESINFTNVTKK